MPRGSELFIESLQRLGTTHIFTLVGDHLNDPLRVADDRGLEIFHTRHESAAVHMADAWARLTAGPGVSFVTGGPGHTNSISGLATAQATGVPLVAISGMANSVAKDRNAFQDLDQLGQVGGVTKYAAAPRHAAQLPFFAKRAFVEATTGRPGVSHLSIAEDVFTAEAAGQPAAYPERLQRPRVRPHGWEVERTIAMLRDAQRPVLIAGSGVWFANAGDPLLAFLSRTGIPVFTINHARGLVPDDHPQCFGYADANLNAAVERALQSADFVLIAGKKVDYMLRLGAPTLISPTAKVAQIDIEPTELGLNRRLDAALCGDAASAIEDLQDAAGQAPFPDWTAWRAEIAGWRQEWQAELRAHAAPEGEYPHPASVASVLADTLPPESTLCFDGGDFVQWCRCIIPARRPARWLRLGALAELGFGFPAALAAQVLRPNERAVCITGDGSLGFFIGEMDTAVRHNLPVIIIVGNDGGWGVERVLQEGLYPQSPTVACELRRTRYDLVMRGFGGDGAYVTKLTELQPALDAAYKSDKPFCINIEITGVGSRLTENALKRKKKT